MQYGYSMVTTTARKGNIKPFMPHVVGRQQPRSKVEAGAAKDYYKIACTIPVLEHLISERHRYFDPNNDALMSSLLYLHVLPGLGYGSFSRRKPSQAALQYYADDLPLHRIFEVELFCLRCKWLNAD